jgi:AbrB family looped-hinge helix DNA binding protein
MASKTAIPEEKIGRVGQRRQVVLPKQMLEELRIREGDFVAFVRKENGVLVKPKRVVDPDDVLSPEERALVKKAEREMRRGKYVTLDQLRHDVDRPRSQRRRKTA